MMEQITRQMKSVREISPEKTSGTEQRGHRQIRVAAYCRVSTDSDEQEMSFEILLRFNFVQILL